MLLAQKLMRLLSRVERGSNLNVLLRIHRYIALTLGILAVLRLLFPQVNQSDVVRNLMMLPARLDEHVAVALAIPVPNEIA